MRRGRKKPHPTYSFKFHIPHGAIANCPLSIVYFLLIIVIHENSKEHVAKGDYHALNPIGFILFILVNLVVVFGGIFMLQEVNSGRRKF